MTMSTSKPGIEKDATAEDYLRELLTTAQQLEENVSSTEQERNGVSEELDAVWTKINQALVREAELKRNRTTIQQLNNASGVEDRQKKANKIFIDQFKALENIMGISIVYEPALKKTEITFDDALKTKISLVCSTKGIMLDEMFPAHPNIEAIRAHLQETGDLVGFLSTLRKKLTPQDS